MLLVVLTNGRREWVDWDRARDYQRKGVLVYILRERDQEPAGYGSGIYEIPVCPHTSHAEVLSVKRIQLDVFERSERCPESSIYE